MKNDHLSFHELSALYDNDISTEEQKNFMLSHIESCRLCGLEYERLRNMMRLIARMGCDDELSDSFCTSVMRTFKRRRVKKLVNRAFPAVAALVFFIFGMGLNEHWNKKDAYDIQYAENQDSLERNDALKVIDIISKNNASILKVTDLYVEGEIPYKDFNKLRRDLAFKKIVYGISPKSSNQGNSDYPGRSNYEEVGVGVVTDYTAGMNPGYLPQEKYIRFRVFK